MCPNKCSQNRLVVSVRTQAKASKSERHQSGSMIVMALFAIIVLALLAGVLVNMISTSSNTVLYEVYGVRAKNAANAGIQELAIASFPLGSAPQQCNQTIVSPTTFSSIQGFENCEFSARCTSTDISFESENYRSFKFTSTGTCGFADVVVSRTVSVDAMQGI